MGIRLWGPGTSGFFFGISVRWWMRCESYSLEKKRWPAERRKNRPPQIRRRLSEFQGGMMEAPRNIRTVIISIVNIESVESGCQPVLIHPPISTHSKLLANANSKD
jgi:hypothetical protein